MKYKREREEFMRVVNKILEYRLTVGTWGNLSMRVEDDKFLITPSAMEYEDMKGEDLVVMDLEGNIISGKKPSTEKFLHMEIYKSRKDVRGILHIHAVYSGVFSVVGIPIPPLTEDMAQGIGGEVKVTDYVPPGTKELALEVVSRLKDKQAVIIRNHGLVTVGDTLKEAFKVATLVERGAEIFILSHLIGEPKILSHEEVKKLREFYKNRYIKRR